MAAGPKDGDIVLHCGHVDHKGQHFYKVNNLPFRPPNVVNVVLAAQWIVQCDDCYTTLHNKVAPSMEDFKIRGHDTWIGDDPCIKHPQHEQN